MKLAPYPEYKDSGSPAAPNIPVQWAVHRCRYLFREVDERSKDGQEIHLSMSQKYGLIDSSKIDKWRLQSESYAGGKVCQNGDLVLNRLKAHLGVFAHAKQSGVVSPDYTVLRPVTDDNPRFFEILFKSPQFITEFTKSTKGIVKGFWRLYTDDFYSIRAVVPPQEEQQQILKFIDVLTARANKFIRNKRRFIELLKEQKQNVINQAVTRGLDPKVKFKPSGVEWIGDIPEHWDARRLKTIAKVVLGKMLKTSPSKDDQLKPYLRSANIQWFEANLSDVASMWFSPSEMEQYRISKNDILVSEGGEVGRACIWQDELEECYIQNSVHKVTAGAEVLPLFLLYQFSAFGSKGAFKAVVNRVSIAHLTREKLVAVFFCKPPIEEQKTILAHIQAKTTEIDQAIIRAEREIELMREYRTRLISDVVTGQVDVRGIEVPEIAEEELLTLDEDTGDADDVIDDEGDMDETD
ncbi:MAG: restriction endonuclease subunit S [Terrimicrobiaceae bacterium]